MTVSTTHQPPPVQVAIAGEALIDLIRRPDGSLLMEGNPGSDAPGGAGAGRGV